MLSIFCRLLQAKIARISHQNIGGKLYFGGNSEFLKNTYLTVIAAHLALTNGYWSSVA